MLVLKLAYGLTIRNAKFYMRQLRELLEAAPRTRVKYRGLKGDEFNLNRLGFPNQTISDSPFWLGRRPAWMGARYSLDLRKRVIAGTKVLAHLGYDADWIKASLPNGAENDPPILEPVELAATR